MRKTFNTDGYCDPEQNYMVDLSDRLRTIKGMVDEGKYFTINRARQYGKTTVLLALSDYLKNDYTVFSLDFQTISYADFETEQRFVAAFSREILDYREWIPESVKEKLEFYSQGSDPEITLSVLFKTLLELCRISEKKIVLIIDEVDTASNNQVFIDFLAQLRAYYLKRRRMRTFQSVILAGVYDIRNIRRRIRPEERHKQNSPWNIAADFDVNMSFSPKDIAGMLTQYEADQKTGMDIPQIAGILYEYTSGYPFLVSRLCKLMDEKLSGMMQFQDKGAAWSKAGVLEAVKLLLTEKNTLFESLINKLTDYPKLKNVLYELLFTGKAIPYNPLNKYIETAEMFGFIKNENGNAVISNRIFETVLYNLFISEEYVDSKIYDAGLREKNQFVCGGHLNMKRVLEKFVETFEHLYGDQSESFLEEAGRRYFMLFLKPIINGTGNCYVEPETRNRERMDLVVDYRGEQFVVELKIWHGEAYNKSGEEQISDYLEYYGLKKGYMISFNFNKKKEVGVKEIGVGDKVLVEAVV